MQKVFVMGVLHINDLQEGLVLAEDVKNRHGDVLLPEGMPLTAKDILILETWSITRDLMAEAIPKVWLAKISLSKGDSWL